MNTKKLKTAVIGIGNMGQNHARIYSKISTLVGVSDLNEDLGQKTAKEYMTKYYKDFKEMLDKEKPQAVSVVVPTHVHKLVAFETLNRKIPTLLEKPIAGNLEDAKSILKKHKEMRTCLMIGHIERFNPVITELKKLLDEGVFGDLVNLSTIRVGIKPPAIPNSDVALDLGIHDVDVFTYLLGQKPIDKKIVYNKIIENNIADSASLLLTYKGNLTCTIQTNWITPIKMRKLFVTGTKAFAEIDNINQKISLYKKDGAKDKYKSYEDFVLLSEPHLVQLDIEKKEPLVEELKFFLNNLNNNDLQITEDAYTALEILMK